MRVIVVGCGGVGSMAAMRLARSGGDVIALERFRVDHDRGSSYGDSRIVRRVYPDRLYTELMADAYALWDDLNARHSGELLVKAGGLYIGPRSNALVNAAEHALAVSGVPFETLTSDACMVRFPAFRLEPDEIALYEPSMGFARASNCVRAAVSEAVEAGADLREETVVERIEASTGGGVNVMLANGVRLAADRAILAVGPWAGPMLERLGVTTALKVTRQPYVHLRPGRNDDAFAVGRFPTWIDAGANAYGFPVLGDLPGAKIGIHDRGVVTTPETVDRDVNESDRAAATRYASRRFPWLSVEVAYEKVCLYTNTPTEDFLIDTIPGIPDALLIGGLSGHGFKFTPLLGDIAARRARGDRIGHDLTRFRLLPG